MVKAQRRHRAPRLLLVSSSLALLLFLPALAAAPNTMTEWGQFHQGAAKSGVASGKLPGEVAVLWTAKARDYVESSAVVANGKVYVASKDKTVVAYDAASGAVAWNQTLADRITATPAVTSDYLFVPAFDGKLHVLDAAKGTKLSTATLAGPSESSPTVKDGILYVGDEKGKVHAFDTAHGSLTKLWEFDTAVKDSAKKVVVEAGPVRVSPTVHGDKVLFGSLNGHLYLVRSNGKPDKTTDLVWVGNVGAPVFASAVVIPAATASATDTVVIPSGGHDGTLRAWSIDAQTNTTSCASLHTNPAAPKDNPCPASLKWSYKVGAAVRSTPAFNGSLLVFGASDGNVYGLNHSRLPGCSDATTTKPCLTFKRATGAQVWSSPAIVDRTVVVGSHDRKLYLLDAKTGLERQTALGLAGSIGSGPAFHAGRLYVTSLDGTLTALGGAAGASASASAARDLEVGSILLLPASPVAGDLVEVVVTVRNSGSVAAASVGVRLERDGQLLLEATLDHVAPGETKSVSRMVTWANTTLLRATVDPDNTVPESDKSNNVLTKRLGPDEEPTGDGNDTKGPGAKAARKGLPAPPLAPLASVLLAALLRRRRAR